MLIKCGTHMGAGGLITFSDISSLIIYKLILHQVGIECVTLIFIICYASATEGGAAGIMFSDFPSVHPAFSRTTRDMNVKLDDSMYYHRKTIWFDSRLSRNQLVNSRYWPCFHDTLFIMRWNIFFFATATLFSSGLYFVNAFIPVFTPRGPDNLRLLSQPFLG